MSKEVHRFPRHIESDRGHREDGSSTHPRFSSTGEPGLQEEAGKWPMIPTQSDPSGIPGSWQRPCQELETICTDGSSQGLLSGQGYSHQAQSSFNLRLPTIGGDVATPSVTPQASHAFEGNLPFHGHTGDYQPWPPLGLTPDTGNSDNSENPLAGTTQPPDSRARARAMAAARTRRYVSRRSERIKAVTGTNSMSNKKYSTRPELKQEFNSETWDNALVTAKRYSKSKPWPKIDEEPLFHKINDNILSSKKSFVALAHHYESAWTRFHEEHYVVTQIGDQKTKPSHGLLLKVHQTRDTLVY